MRWKFSGFTAALALFGFVASVGTATARSKPKAAPAAAPQKKKAAELLTDDRAINKQMQWEEKVMGPNERKDELAKIARAQAITKAAAEKAAADKAAGIDKEPSPAASRPQSKSTVAMPALPDEGDLNSGSSKTKISPKLATEQAAAPVPAAKPADDKFIDKLLNSDGPMKKKSSSKANDSELDQLLANGAAAAPSKRKTKNGKGDSVDSLIASAEKEADKPLPKQKQPDWTKPEIAPAAPPPPPPVVVKSPPKKTGGVIHVVQGANFGARTATIAAPPPMPGRRATAPAPEPVVSRRETSAKSASWRDPFADGNSSKSKATTTAPATKKEGAAHGPGWRDPFADGPAEHSKPKRTPAEPKRNSDPPASSPNNAPENQPGWKDPFTENTKGGRRARVASAETHKPEAAIAETHRPVVAIAETHKPEQTKWEAATRRTSKASASGDGPSSRWAILKKR